MAKDSDDDAELNGIIVGAAAYETPPVSGRRSRAGSQIRKGVDADGRAARVGATATNIYERWETADCPARNERRGLSAYSGEFVEAWEAVYQHRMEVNGVLPPFNHESRTYKALVKKAEAAPKVRRGLSAQLDALTGEADNRDLFGDREKYADAVQARALQQMESLKRIRSYESDACNAKRRLSFSSAVELVGELVEQLLRAKMSTAGDGRAWLPACTDPLTGVGGWGPPLNVMHAD